MSQTPNFDRAINEILAEIKPHQKTCPQCGSVFDIFQEDIEFYKMFKVPPPTLCPACRLQRRMGYRNNLWPIFYKKICSAPGHHEKVISSHAEDDPIKIYDYNFWHSDAWEPMDFGRNYNFTENFFSQFKDFAWYIPHVSLYKDPKGVNSDYVLSGLQPKNCYYSTVPYRSEDVYYSVLTLYCRDCVDCLQLDNCEQCYDSIHLYRCHSCFFCYDCSECLNSYFLFNCRNCQHCFGCDNLRNKKYYFFNQPLSKEDYETKLKAINLGKRTVLREYQNKFGEILSLAIHRDNSNLKVINSIGNDLRECRDCFWCFEIWGGCENMRYCQSTEKSNNAMDFFGGSFDSFIYESSGISYCNNMKFCVQCRYSSSLEYCVECKQCDFCFGCFGLNNKKYYIFNKPYSKSDYWALIDKIKSQMLQTGEYGQFFPLTDSWVSYNNSSAFVDFPLAEQEARQRGWHWQNEVESELDLSKFSALQAKDIPDDIADVADDILDKVLICEQTNKPFRLTKHELDFYRQHKLPLPAVHPLQRIKNRFVFRHPYKLWKDVCFNCKKEMHSGWDPAKKYKVYCGPATSKKLFSYLRERWVNLDCCIL